MAHAAVAGRRTRRFVPRLRLRRLLPHRPPVRLERTVSGVRRQSPRARAEGDYGHRHQPLRHGPLVDERPTFQGLDTPVPRIHRDERLLLDEHGSQRFALRPRPAGERLVRAVDARHEPRQSLRAAIFQAMGRVVDRVCRPGRVPRRHLPLQREGADERVVRGRTQGIP